MANWVVPTAAALIGGLSGGLLAPWAKARFDLRHQRHLAFDRAITAVKAVLYAYTAPTEISRDELGDSAQAQAFLDQLRPRRMERFIDATYAMRQSLAELEPFHQAVWDRQKFQLEPDELMRLADQLKQAR